jgi:hypothetical protein
MTGTLPGGDYPLTSSMSQPFEHPRMGSRWQLSETSRSIGLGVNSGDDLPPLLGEDALAFRPQSPATDAASRSIVGRITNV